MAGRLEILRRANVSANGLPASTDLETVAVQRTRLPRMTRLELTVLAETTDPCECVDGLLARWLPAQPAAASVIASEQRGRHQAPHPTEDTTQRGPNVTHRVEE